MKVGPLQFPELMEKGLLRHENIFERRRATFPEISRKMLDIASRSGTMLGLRFLEEIMRSGYQKVPIQRLQGGPILPWRLSQFLPQQAVFTQTG